MKSKLGEPDDALFRVQRGLCGYVSYLAACEMNESFSEYVLYEPILRVLSARGYDVQCEYECPGVDQPKRGDKKRLDFFAKNGDIEFALEVKWATKPRVDIRSDLEKLAGFQKEFPNASSLLCIFGRRSVIENVSLNTDRLKERLKGVYADLIRTRYGCRIFQWHAP